MGMTMTQKILAAHAGLDKVEPGQLIMAKLDMVLGNDITSQNQSGNGSFRAQQGYQGCAADQAEP